ncbi:MAG TPA: GtrA family protein [Flavisolibacter sp.]|jgi:putative flippase GtrA|nr:GtrA family protein [Flavisolibacter sp.]
MITFIKAQMSSFIASGMDNCCTVFAAEALGIWYVWAAAIGTIIGGIINFSLGRNWVFQSKEKGQLDQAKRYLLVWLIYLGLATSGVYLLTHYLHINYIFSKLAVSLILAIGYNYPLQKRYVFKKPAP